MLPVVLTVPLTEDAVKPLLTGARISTRESAAAVPRTTEPMPVVIITVPPGPTCRLPVVTIPLNEPSTAAIPPVTSRVEAGIVEPIPTLFRSEGA